MLATEPRSSAFFPAAHNRRPAATLTNRSARRRPNPGCSKLASGLPRSQRPFLARPCRPECGVHAGVSRRRGCDVVVDPGLDPNTGLIYLHARYYDPTTGQFMSSDPLEAITQQPYSYANDDPINGTDPTGLGCGTPDPGGCVNDVTGWAGGQVNNLAGTDVGGDVVNYFGTHTVAVCANGALGLGYYVTASGCVGLVGGRPSVFGDVGGGGTTATASLTGGVLVSNATTMNQLTGKFALAGASGGEGLVAGDDVSWGSGSCGQTIWENQLSAGVGGNLPLPVEGHVGLTYTWGLTP